MRVLNDGFRVPCFVICSVWDPNDRRLDAEHRIVPEEKFGKTALPALSVRDVEQRTSQDSLHPPRAAALEVQVLRDPGTTLVRFQSQSCCFKSGFMNRKERCKNVSLEQIAHLCLDVPNFLSGVACWSHLNGKEVETFSPGNTFGVILSLQIRVAKAHQDASSGKTAVHDKTGPGLFTGARKPG